MSRPARIDELTSGDHRASMVAAIPAASTDAALRHFSARLAFETDPADVAADIAARTTPYTILDVRSSATYARGHLPGAISCPASSIDARTAADLPPGPLVVYCWGPGCNGAQKAAARLAAHGRQVKEMIGGFEYWLREGQPVEGEHADRLSALADPDLVG